MYVAHVLLQAVKGLVFRVTRGSIGGTSNVDKLLLFLASLFIASQIVLGISSLLLDSLALNGFRYMATGILALLIGPYLVHLVHHLKIQIQAVTSSIDERASHEFTQENSEAVIGTATTRLLKRLTKILLMFGTATVLIIISCALAAAWALSSDKTRFSDAHREELRNYDAVTDSLYYTLLAVPFTFLYYAWNPISKMECYYGSRRHESYE